MSWSGFKKNVNRATTQVMMKTGHVEKTSDREYEVEERRYRTLESASLRLQKEAKGYLDSLRAMTASQMRIAETIDAFYGDSGAKDGVSRSYKQAVEDLDAETVKALDGPYRTTVLEPINRFCAYFPDVNECIKKRNHKMLDYDAMRSKVKKLTEKPDKDPGKLPRTEKETEMVSIADLFLDDPPQHTRNRTFSLAEILNQDRMDPAVPYPPMISRRHELLAHRYADQGRQFAGQDPSLCRVKRPSPSHTPLIVNSAPGDDASQHSVSPISTPSTVVKSGSGTPSTLSPRLESPVFPSKRFQAHSTTPPQPALYPLTLVASSTSSLASGNKHQPTSRGTTSAATSDDQSSGHFSFKSSKTSSSLFRTNKNTLSFFNPSDLEDIMAPLRAEFIQREANSLAQAKAAYEQLNEQLTNELPQLIDLRVPYLDPSFEALVKIQLRFCAEAYSRMAQVQQYLDASTRDQYASGDLDARVEEVLGQIRELSIAGTV